MVEYFFFLKAGHDLSSISFFQRGTAQEFITFTSRILVERTALGARQSVKEYRSSKLTVLFLYDKKSKMSHFHS
jgi:hypothetical protein